MNTFSYDFLFVAVLKVKVFYIRRWGNGTRASLKASLEVQVVGRGCVYGRIRARKEKQG